MQNILNRAGELYRDFDFLYFSPGRGNCGECFACCSAGTGYPKISSMEYDFLEAFTSRNDTGTSAENIKKYMENHSSDVCPGYNKGCIVYSARPLCCRVFGLFRFEKERALPIFCAYNDKIIPVLNSEKYSVIKNLGEFLELKYKYEILKIDGEENRLDAIVNLGEEYIRQNNITEALSVFKRGEKISPCNTKILFNFGFIYRAIGETDRAINKFEESIKSGGEKEYPYVYQNLGFIYLGLNIIDKAKEYFARALLAEPYEALPYIGMAFCKVSDGNSEAAREYADRALQIEPDNALAVNLVKCLT